MKSLKPSAGIKRKIFAGFLLLLTLIFVSVFSVIKLSSKLSPSDPALSSSVTKLTITSNLLSSIIQSDGHARAFLNTGDSVYLHQYNKADKITRELIDSLEYSSLSNTNQFLRILTVDSLLDLKRLTFNNFFIVRKPLPGKKQVDFTRLVPRYSDSVKVSNKTIAKTVIEQHPVQPAKKKGFFGRLWSGITGKKASDSSLIQGPVLDVRYDTILTYKAVRDTTLNQVRSQLKKMEAKENLARQQAIEREMMLIQADQDLMNEIRAILLLYEKEEVAKAIAATENSRSVLNSLWQTALVLALMGILTTIGFLVMIWKDLARSSYYRRQLEEARTLAESLLKVKEQFLANMSHEIRTPLTSIIGFSERLTETKVDREQSRYIKYIVSSSEHLLELINDLLDFTRIGTGRLTLESKSFDPAELFDEAYEALKPKADDKGLETILKQNIPHVNLIGDPLRIRQIVINLLNNSIKFTEKGKVMLQTKVQLSADKKQANIVIRVADTGIGIPAEKLDYIFEEFSQVDHSITRKYGGSGLGLAITKKLVEMMDGTINVLSREDQGTIFTVKFSLPVSDFVENDLREEAPVMRDLSDVHILVAEDDDTTRILLTELLQKYNAKVKSTSDGSEALSAFMLNPGLFRVVITDIRMPGLSGPELVQKIRSECDSRNQNTPVIIGLTAHADTNEIAGYRASGIDYFILKPFKNHEILKALNITDGLDVTEKKEVPAIIDNDSLDLSTFRKFAGDDEDSLTRIISSLELNIARTSDEMLKAYKAKDYSELSLLAHRMIPNIKLLGAKQVTEQLRQIEVACKQHPVDESILSTNFNNCLIELDIIRKKLAETHLNKA